MLPGLNDELLKYELHQMRHEELLREAAQARLLRTVPPKLAPSGVDSNPAQTPVTQA
jgi:hypothetical protein